MAHTVLGHLVSADPERRGRWCSAVGLVAACGACLGQTAQPEVPAGLPAGLPVTGLPAELPQIPGFDPAALEQLLRALQPSLPAVQASAQPAGGGAGAVAGGKEAAGGSGAQPGGAGGGREGPNPGDLERLRGSVRVDEFERIELHVVNEDLSTVLRLLSIESERNIIVSSSITARVTAELYGVGFYEALGAMLEANGLGYLERGRFIYVYTAEELAAARAATTPREARVIELHYLSPQDAVGFARPLLSEGGSLSTTTATPDFAIPEEDPTGSDSYASGSVVVVHDFPDRIAAIEALLAELDARPRQVLIEATILRAEITEDNALGVDFSVLADLEFPEIATPLSAVDNLLSGLTQSDESAAVTSTVGGTAAAGGLKVGIVTDDVAVFIRALDEVTDTTTISRPKLLTLNRQPARVLVGTRVGFLNSTTTNDNTTTQQVAFLDTGTQLRVRPFIMRDGQIRLELKPQVSFAELRETPSPGGGVISIPDEDTTELVANLIVRDGQTVVLGGLFTESTTTARRQVPGLGDIPGVGTAFRGHDDSVTRSEIIFLIRPTIVGDEELWRQGREGDRATELARLGARRGLLPWSREQRVGQLLIDAERLRREGDVPMAMLKVERALGLSPHSPEAARMRDRLFADEMQWPEHSILDSIIRGRP